MNTKQLMCSLVVAAVLLASAPVANAQYYDNDRYGGNYGYPGNYSYDGNYGYPGKYGGLGNYGGYDNYYGGWLGKLLGGGGKGKWGKYGYGK
ncbi:neuropeptide-like protein 30 [Dreissena polymorpha]|uniref:Uncharacterized protein n=1 Tax=Dreissena polymorpha TaxID=45954 RepID=A0A9D4D6K2_DREPO|nr:neuropeptide-like protein 30 [Dreissena polymorpha]KAH3739025.1 hypothetical protein DPMN_045669 [Dreissena polymorpha]